MCVSDFCKVKDQIARWTHKELKITDKSVKLLIYKPLVVTLLDSYLENWFKITNYWGDAYARMWNNLVDNMITSTMLANNMVFATMEAFGTSIHQANDNSNESSKDIIKASRTFARILGNVSYNASGSGGANVDHYYSISPAVPEGGYTFDEHHGYVLTTPGPDRTPLYEYYNGGASDHYYSISPAVTTEGYYREGTQGYVFARPLTDRAPLYRFYYPGKSYYNYDTFNPEFYPGTDRYYYSTKLTIPDDIPFKDKGYVFQGIEGYVSTTTPGPDSSDKQLHKYWSKEKDDWYLSTDPTPPPPDYVDYSGKYDEPLMYVFTSDWDLDRTHVPDRTRLYRGYAFAAGGATHYYSTTRRYSSADFTDESDYDIMYVHATAGDGRTPLYQFYNGGSTDHYYSMSPAAPAVGYNLEKHQGYVLANPLPDRAPFYRFHYPGTPVYSADSLIPEPDPRYERYYYSTIPTIPAGYGWTFQGIEGYVDTTPGPDKKQLYRFRNIDKVPDDRYYSTDPTAPPSYEPEPGLVMYVFSSPGPGRTQLYNGYTLVSDGGSHYYSTVRRPSSDDFRDESDIHDAMYVYATAGEDRTPLYQFTQVWKDEGDWLSDIVDTFSDIVKGVVGLVTSVIDVVNDTLDNTVGWIVNGIGAAFEQFVLSIPLVGRFLGEIFHVVQEIVNFFVNLPDFVLSLVGIRPEKRMKLRVIIQRDGQGQLVAQPDVVKPYIQNAINIFKNEANVRIIPSGSFVFSSPLDKSKTFDLDNYIFIESEPSGSDTIDVYCGIEAAADDLAGPGISTGSDIEIKMSKDDFSGAGRRVIGSGSSICAFAVKNFYKWRAGPREISNTVGCSLGPLTDYVTVLFQPELADLSKAIAAGRITLDEIKKGRSIATTLAHELGHACNLSHKEFYVGDDVDKDNLMFPGGDDGRPSGTSLSRFQISVLRSSRHVTY